jgi:hypothetical protein
MKAIDDEDRIHRKDSIEGNVITMICTVMTWNVRNDLYREGVVASLVVVRFANMCGRRQYVWRLTGICEAVVN